MGSAVRPWRSADLVRQRRQAVGAPRDQRDVVAALGEEPRQRRADAGRRPGDQRKRFSHWTGVSPWDTSVTPVATPHDAT